MRQQNRFEFRFKTIENAEALGDELQLRARLGILEGVSAPTDDERNAKATKSPLLYSKH